MLRLFKKSLQTGIVTTLYPEKKDTPSPSFRGLPEWQEDKCRHCQKCAEVCPTQAITIGAEKWSIDPKKCLFCGYCTDQCSNQAVNMGEKFELAESASPDVTKIYGRSIHIRHLDSGSCNGCDWEMTTLNGPIYDIQRLGFDFVASPRHADILMVTGPVTRNLEIAAHKTFSATPAPKLVLAVGTCACSGGICGKSYASNGGVNNILPVDVYIPGCPPRPQALIQGLLQAVDRWEK